VLNNQNEKATTSINFILEEKKIAVKDSTIIAANKEFINHFNNVKDSLNAEILNLRELKKDIEDANSKNSDLFKLVLALIGAVFVIVGFFGFKSIQELRESALKNAVSEAQRTAETKAKEIAELESKKIAGDKAEEVADKVAKKVAIEEAEKETQKYLQEKFPEYFKKWEDTYKKEIDQTLTDLSDRLDKVENPESYGIENKKVKELTEKYTELMSVLHAVRLDLFKKENDEHRD
jgi:hypothetical protein